MNIYFAFEIIILHDNDVTFTSELTNYQTNIYIYFKLVKSGNL